MEGKEGLRIVIDHLLSVLELLCRIKGLYLGDNGCLAVILRLHLISFIHFFPVSTYSSLTLPVSSHPPTVKVPIQPRGFL